MVLFRVDSGWSVKFQVACKLANVEHCPRMDRFTSMMISNNARAFLDAAIIVRSQKSEVSAITFVPLYFLACQAIELSLKAYLRGTGYGQKDLVRLGHNLSKCVEAARAAGVEQHISFAAEEAAIVAMINPYYQSKDLQYSITGLKHRPQPDLLIALAERLWRALRSFCKQRREYHFGKPTAIA